MYLKGRPITMFMPKDQVEGYCLEARGELPSNKLKLDWVYPYCSRGTQGSHITCVITILFHYLLALIKTQNTILFLIGNIFEKLLSAKNKIQVVPVMQVRQEATDVMSQMYFHHEALAQSELGLMALSPAVSNNLQKQSAAPLVLFYFYFVSCVVFSSFHFVAERMKVVLLLNSAETQRGKSCRGKQRHD